MAYMTLVGESPHSSDVLTFSRSIGLDLKTGRTWKLIDEHLAFLMEITDEVVRELMLAPGFNQLTEFGCSEICHLSHETMESLRATGVVINLINIEP